MLIERTTITSTIVMGVSAVLTTLFGIVGTKFIAFKLGAEGVGIQGIYTTMVALAAGVFGCSLANSGTQYIAKYAGNDSHKFSQIYQTVRMLGRFLGLLGFVFVLGVMYLWPTQSVFSSLDGFSGFWLALGALFAIVLSAQRAQLNGTRNLNSLALVNVVGAGAGVTAAIVFVSLFGHAGLDSLLIAPYFFGCVAGAIVLNRSKLEVKCCKPSLQWTGKIIGIGWVITLGVVVVQATQLLVRIWLEATASLEMVGYFHAAWLIGMTYIGFLLSAMIAEYYPRLSGIASDNEKFSSAINNQMKLCFLVAPPIIFSGIIFSGPIMTILYTSEFSGSAILLKYLLVGDIFKLAAWAIAIGLLVKEKKYSYLLAEVLWNLIFFGLIVIIYDSQGLNGFGFSYIVSYIVYFIFTLWRLSASTGFLFDLKCIKYLLLIFVICLGCLLADPQKIHEYLFYSTLIIAYSVFSYMVLRKRLIQ